MEIIDKPNPYLEQEDFFKPYNENIADLKNNPELIEFDKICHEVFEHNPSGKAFMEMVKERFFLRSMVTKGSPTYQLDVLWQEGFRDAWIMIMSAVQSHKQRINAGT